MPDPDPKNHERARLWTIELIGMPLLTAYGTEAEIDAWMERQGRPGSRRYASEAIEATALAGERKRHVAAIRKALEFCYRCGGGIAADAEAPYCETECAIPADGGDHPSLIDHLVTAINAVDCECCDGGVIHNAWGEDGVTIPCPDCRGHSTSDHAPKEDDNGR